MKKNKIDEKKVLRDKAEKKIIKLEETEKKVLDEAETHKLLHELQVHQIELEMMNEELRIARDKAETLALKYEELYDFAPFGYLTLDKDGNIKDINLRSAKLLGKDRSILINDNFKLFIDTGSSQILEDFFQKVFADNFKASCELMLRTNDNISQYIYLEGSKTGEQCFITMIDITQRRLLEESLNQTLLALKRSNADLKQFAYAASHDLKEPLRMISIFTSFLEKRSASTLDNESSEYMKFIIDGTKRMHSLIDDIISYSTISSSDIEKSLTDLNIIVVEVLDNLQLSISESRSEIKIEKLPVIKANSAQMKQLFQNLISNAIKFREKDNPFINISSEDSGKYLLFKIKDNGIGIPQKDSERIFLIFQRLHSKEKYPGTGIGLALCKQIVENHGGTIWVNSEVGKGSEFLFTIPK